MLMYLLRFHVKLNLQILNAHDKYFKLSILKEIKKYPATLTTLSLVIKKVHRASSIPQNGVKIRRLQKKSTASYPRVRANTFVAAEYKRCIPLAACTPGVSLGTRITTQQCQLRLMRLRERNEQFVPSGRVASLYTCTRTQ